MPDLHRIFSKSNDEPEAGSIIVSILVITIFLTTLIFSLLVLANANLSRAKGRLFLLQAQYAAESGADAAIAVLNSGNETYTGSGGEVIVLNTTRYKSTYIMTVAAGVDGKEKIITATGKVYTPPTAATAQFTRTIEVTTQRSTTSTASSLLSRNIIDVSSGVKNIQSVDVYVNGYINMNKNTTNLVAENIVVADKNTGASNCSIGGTGNLVKPTTFTHVGQTKTNITTAFNNCVSPPGNTTNSSFDVLANQANISKIQSILIPVSQYMDASYQNSPGGCNDWTTGSFPRDIPGTGNTKKTHYPDSASGISASCGTSGNIQLATGQYNIKNHAHIRANLCATTACTPTFYNPDSGAAGIKFVFVEGTINFSSVQSAAGSGPIVFVTYGGDPASLAATCPLGGSIYLGSSGNSTAPAIFFLSLNGICLDKTKFGASPALGGVGGKNISISTNPGSPWDLKLDPSFPVSSIPIDLAWRAVRYRRP